MKANKRIVVIDDELDVRKYLTALLGDHGFEVTSAGNGRDGFALVVGQHPDLVCLDLLMPEQTGLSLYKLIRDADELDEVPVLIISGLGVEQSIEQILTGLPKPEGYLEKPVEIDRFIEKVHQLINNGRST